MIQQEMYGYSDGNYSDESPMDVLESIQVLNPKRLSFKDNFKTISVQKEKKNNNPYTWRLTPKEMTLINYYKGTEVQWCFPFRTNINKSNLKTYKDEVTGEVTISYLDPDTLNKDDDNDIIMSDAGNSSSFNQKGHRTKSSTLLVGDNFFYLTDTNIISRINGGITDCVVFNYHQNLNYAPTDVLLVIQRDGTLLSILPQKYDCPLQQLFENNPIDTISGNVLFVKHHEKKLDKFYKYLEYPTRDHSIILQHMKLKPNQNWKLIKNPKNNTDFILVDMKFGTIKFFKFTSQFHFKFIETIRFDCSKITSCYFLPDKNNKVFISLIVAKRISHFYIEWDDITSKKIYKVNHPSCELMKCSLPVGQDNLLLCSNKKIVLISTQQIVSGDTNYVDFENNILRGIKSWFDDSALTTKLINVINSKNLTSNPLTEKAECSIVLTSTSVLYAIFVIEENKDLQLFSLGRFKELRDLYSDINQDDAKENSHMLVTSILNRTVRLELDLNHIKHVLFSSKQLPKRKPVENKTTISSNSDSNNFKIAHVTERNEVWLAGNSSILQLSDDSIVPLKKSKKVGKFHHSFRNYESIRIFESIDIHNQLLPKRLLGVYDNGSFDEFKFCDGIQDFRKENEASSIKAVLFYKQFSTHSIIVTKKQVTLATDYLNKIMLFLDSEIDGVCSLLDKMIVWSKSGRKAFFLSHIDNIETISHSTSDYFDNLIKTENDFSFHLCYHFDNTDDDDLTVVLHTSVKSFISYWHLIESSGSLIPKPHVIQENCNRFAMLPNGFFCYSNFEDPSKIKYGRYLWNQTNTETFQTSVETNGKTDFTLKCLNNNKSIAVIYPDKLYLFNHKATEEIYDEDASDNKIKAYPNFTNDSVFSIEEVKLPQFDSHKPSYLMDVESVNFDGRELLCLLYDNGMQCIETTYITWNNTDYLLHNTKSKNKIFTHLTNLNRMLVVNCDSNDWHLMNLDNGKIKLLDSETLKESGEKIQNIMEIPSSNADLKKSTILVIIFNTIVVRVQLSIYQNDVLIGCANKYEFEGNLHKEYGLCEKNLTLLEIENNKEIFHRYDIDKSNGSIHFANKFSIKSRSPTTHFVAGYDYLVLAGKVNGSPHIVMLHDTNVLSGPLTNRDILNSVKVQKERYPPVRKLYQLTDKFVAVTLERCDFLSSNSQIIIIPMSKNFNGRSFNRSTLQNNYDDVNVMCFWDFIDKNSTGFWVSAEDPILNKGFHEKFNYIGGHYELFNQFQFRNSSIKLDKNVIDLCYKNDVLNVLCQDQSLLQFSLSDLYFDYKRAVLNDITDDVDNLTLPMNHGYYIDLTDKSFKPDIWSKEADINLSYIDAWGRHVLNG